jgi:predicted ATPase
LQPYGAFDDEADHVDGSEIAQEGMSQNLPARLVRTFGRDSEVAAISAQLIKKRFVSVIGPGGVGKTTVAVVVGHGMLERFRGAVYLIDLNPVHESSLVGNLVAAILGVIVRTGDALADIADFLRPKAVLLIFDGCEHVIDRVAELAERIFKTATRSSILITSREPLRSEGEHVHPLRPLPCPPQGKDLSVAETSGFEAVQLFLDRTAIDGNPVQLTDALAPLVAGVCRGADGLPLAIELAAQHAATFGVDATAQLVAGGGQLQWRGHRTALRRHATLSGMLDWSHALLTDDERVVFRRLAVFPEAAEALDHIRLVIAHRESATEILKAFEGLVSKSLVVADFEGPSPRYRLLVTTRAYARAKLAASGEGLRFEQRYAELRRALSSA